MVMTGITNATPAVTLASNSSSTAALNTWGAEPWVAASRIFVAKANDYLKAMD